MTDGMSVKALDVRFRTFISLHQHLKRPKFAEWRSIKQYVASLVFVWSQPTVGLNLHVRSIAPDITGKGTRDDVRLHKSRVTAIETTTNFDWALRPERPPAPTARPTGPCQIQFN